MLKPCAALLALLGILLGAPARAEPNHLVPVAHFAVHCTGAARPAEAAALARVALEAALEKRAAAGEVEAAFGQFDTMLTSMYGLRRPLAQLPQGAGRAAMARTAFLVINDYVIAAQMQHGAMARGGKLPADALEISGNMVYALVEPYDEASSLQRLWDRTSAGDRALARMASAPRVYGRWALRAIFYADPIALEAAMAGYCAAGPGTADNALLENLARAR